MKDFLQVAGDLFAMNPVREVTLTDKSPYQLNRQRHADRPWFWAKVSGGSLPGARSHWMPGVVLDSPVWKKTSSRTYHESPTYGSQQEAVAAMSLALADYGRSLAGLPPLPARQTVA